MYLDVRNPAQRVQRDGPTLRITEATRELLRKAKQLEGAPSFDALISGMVTGLLARHGVESPTR